MFAIESLTTGAEILVSVDRRAGRIVGPAELGADGAEWTRVHDVDVVGLEVWVSTPWGVWCVPAGTTVSAVVVRGYVDLRNRAQTAVDGPHGTFLVTRKCDGDPFEVWRSDSLRTAHRTPNHAGAIARARSLAGHY